MAKKFKNDSVQTQGDSLPPTKLVNSSENTSKLQQATNLLLCDMNIFRSHDFPLASENIDVAPVNHPCLVKTSDQPSFYSSNFSPFISADAVRLSDIVVEHQRK
jgi:hypothetical protein